MISHPFSQNFTLKWAEWVEYKKAIKKPYKLLKTQQMQIDKYVKAGFTEREISEAIDKAILNEWIGFHPEKSDNGQRTNQNSAGNTGSKKLGTSAARIEALRNWGKV